MGFGLLFISHLIFSVTICLTLLNLWFLLSSGFVILFWTLGLLTCVVLGSLSSQIPGEEFRNTTRLLKRVLLFLLFSIVHNSRTIYNKRENSPNLDK